MDHYLQFRREERTGKYSGYKYPNLIEVQKSPHLHLGYFANVTEDLVLAAFRGEEELTTEEIKNVARYNNIPFSVLTCPRVIMLDMGRARHRKLVEDVKDQYARLKRMAEDGNQEAGYYLRHGERDHQHFLEAVHDDRLSYVCYLGQKKEISDRILLATPRPEKRGVRRAVSER